MTNGTSFNAGRWILGIQALVFFVIGGFEIAAFPTEACTYMGRARGVVADLIACPSYSGAQPVFEMYTLSLGKHIAMIGLVFLYFAVRGRSQAAIQVGLIYAPIALLFDWIPVVTWLGASGASDSVFPVIAQVAVLSTLLSAAGLWANAHHPEWSRSG